MRVLLQARRQLHHNSRLDFVRLEVVAIRPGMEAAPSCAASASRTILAAAPEFAAVIAPS
ncbi:hypothetical protein [Poseidonocella sp. HB161398]|uniref:hypothetical protein n=1 Tax=Poseidonocella sp. HB161398 TaxID=2320855 RepID=UPI0011095B1A|nr:hypothetical protein [Poseidonocella sp. HB161398]